MAFKGHQETLLSRTHYHFPPTVLPHYLGLVFSLV